MNSNLFIDGNMKELHKVLHNFECRGDQILIKSLKI